MDIGLVLERQVPFKVTKNMAECASVTVVVLVLQLTSESNTLMLPVNQ